MDIWLITFQFKVARRDDLKTPFSNPIRFITSVFLQPIPAVLEITVRYLWFQWIVGSGSEYFSCFLLSELKKIPLHSKHIEAGPESQI